MPHDLNVFFICSSYSCLPKIRGQEIDCMYGTLQAKSTHCCHRMKKENVAIAEEVLFVSKFLYHVKSQAFEKEGGKEKENKTYYIS